MSTKNIEEYASASVTLETGGKMSDFVVFAKHPLFV